MKRTRDHIEGIFFLTFAKRHDSQRTQPFTSVREIHYLRYFNKIFVSWPLAYPNEYELLLGEINRQSGMGRHITGTSEELAALFFALDYGFHRSVRPRAALPLLLELYFFVRQF